MRLRLSNKYLRQLRQFFLDPRLQNYIIIIIIIIYLFIIYFLYLGLKYEPIDPKKSAVTAVNTSLVRRMARNSIQKVRQS